MPAHALKTVIQQLDNAAREAGRPAPRLLAVSKHQPATAVAEFARAWTRLERSGHEQAAFGENYVQEAQAKQAELARPAGDESFQLVEWHLIGYLQSNKAREAATIFDWVQTIDRSSLVAALGKHRPADRAPLNVLVQVNIDDEAGKHGCSPEEIDTLAAAIDAQPRLALRGLMAIPAPHPERIRRREAFARMKALFDRLRAERSQVDTLSMGMSEDFDLAIAEGATMVRIGTALFGPRGPAAQGMSLACA